MTSPPAPRGSSPWTDLARPPLREAALRSALVVDGSLWRDLRIVERTESTNADVAAAARAGSPEGLVVLAEEQTAGRGRGRRARGGPGPLRPGPLGAAPPPAAAGVLGVAAAARRGLGDRGTAGTLGP